MVLVMAYERKAESVFVSLAFAAAAWRMWRLWKM
jgi:hypothetical protein